MKITLKIFALIAVATLLNTSCGKKQEEGDGHSNETENRQADKAKEEHKDDDPPAITALTQEQIKAVGITYGEIEMKELTATIRANGNLRVPNDRKATVTSLYGGAIKTINVQVGDYVRKGQLIATITNPQFIQLQEEYLTAASQIVFAEQEYSRQKELFDNNAGTKKNLQNAEAGLKTLRTQRASLEKQIQLMGINPANVSNNSLKSGLAVTAPISGTISNVLAQIGSYIDASSPVAEIVDNASLHLDLNVFEKDIPVLKTGQTIHFTLSNNPENEYDAEIFSIGAAFENESKTIPVHAKVNGNKTGLIDGMNITGIVSLSNVLTPAVPKDAIVNAAGKYYIFIVTDKKPEEHEPKEEGHKHEKNEPGHEKESGDIVNFEKIEVVTGVSDMGYVAITPINEMPRNAKVVSKGAFFIDAKLSNTAGHSH